MSWKSFVFSHSTSEYFFRVYEKETILILLNFSDKNFPQKWSYERERTLHQCYFIGRVWSAWSCGDILYVQIILHLPWKHKKSPTFHWLDSGFTVYRPCAFPTDPPLSESHKITSLPERIVSPNRIWFTKNVFDVSASNDSILKYWFQFCIFFYSFSNMHHFLNGIFYQICVVHYPLSKANW